MDASRCPAFIGSKDSGISYGLIQHFFCCNYITYLRIIDFAMLLVLIIPSVQLYIYSDSRYHPLLH